MLSEAHIHTIPTFQKTGIKLKLINTLFRGRHILTTSEMVEDTGLENLCHIANTKLEFREKVLELAGKGYSTDDFVLRKEKLKQFDTKK